MQQHMYYQYYTQAMISTYAQPMYCVFISVHDCSNSTCSFLCMIVAAQSRQPQPQLPHLCRKMVRMPKARAMAHAC